ncbi:hypothetical protein [Thermoactinospora rubra]|uniref:hypothetical protein n=1 Tax=Thermoactinospora rubra TaxID=1088767 RepID=UPI000A116363|nr:hypothetical protein [Thermoactinospora rubra]
MFGEELLQPVRQDRHALPETASPSSTESSEDDATVADTGTDDEADTGGNDAAAGQAAQVEDMLDRSHSSRSNLSSAIDDAVRCEANGVETIEEITRSRKSQLAAAEALDTGALPSGEEVKESLVEALDASYRADAAFLSWARRYQDRGCTGAVARDRDYRRGLAHSKSAQAAKARFAELWRPIAETYSLTAWTADDI